MRRAPREEPRGQLGDVVDSIQKRDDQRRVRRVLWLRPIEQIEGEKTQSGAQAHGLRVVEFGMREPERVVDVGMVRVCDERPYYGQDGDDGEEDTPWRGCGG